MLGCMDEPHAVGGPVDRPSDEHAAEPDAARPWAPPYWPHVGQPPVEPAAGSAIGDEPAPAQPPFGGTSELPPYPPTAHAEPLPGTPSSNDAPGGFGSPPPPPPLPTPGTASGSTPPPAARRRGGKTAAAAVAVLALLGGAGGGWLAGHAASDNGTATNTTVPIDRASDHLSGSSLDVASVLKKVEPSVVSITTQITQQPQGPFDYGFNNGGGWDNGGGGSGGVVGQAAGTGIILTSDGEVLTNAHVIQDASSIKVTLTNGHSYTAKVVGSDTSQDLALLQLQGASGLTPASLGDSSAVQVGDDVVAIGNALALSGGPTVTRGIVSAVNRSIDEDNGTLNGLIQTDAAISSGNSGGPLVNAQGQVVGMNTAVASSSGSTQASNIGFAISINHAKSLFGELRNGGSH